MKTNILILLLLTLCIFTNCVMGGDIILCTSSILTPAQTNSVEQGLNNGDLYREPTGSINKIENWARYTKGGVVWRICVYNDAWLLNFTSHVPTVAQMNQWIVSLGIGQSPKRIDVIQTTNSVLETLIAEGYEPIP